MMNEVYNITHAYTEKCEVKKAKYNFFEFPHWNLGPFVIHKSFRKIINQYDIVIINAHLRSLRIVLLPFLPHKPKLISWSIGLHVTYNKKFNLDKAPDFKDRVFQSIQNHCDACIFYMPEPIEYWKRYSKIDVNKYFVAHNTVKVAEFEKLPLIEERDKFLFVGTLYQQKGLGDLIEAYALAKQRCDNLFKLYIVGKGPEEQLIKDLIEEKGLGDSVVMTGAIYDEDVLKDYFLTSLLCISPKQAGLSVQRIQEGFSILFSKDGGGLSDSTFGLSLMLVPFFLQNPLFGVSLGEYKTAMGYSIGGDGFSSSDAQLLYVLCEIGIIGLVIYLTPYFKYLKSLKVDRKKTGINLLLVTVLLLSIVDLGLFLTDIAYMFVIGIVLLVSVEGGTNFKLEKR